MPKLPFFGNKGPMNPLFDRKDKTPLDAVQLASSINSVVVDLQAFFDTLHINVRVRQQTMYNAPGHWWDTRSFIVINADNTPTFKKHPNYKLIKDLLTRRFGRENTTWCAGIETSRDGEGQPLLSIYIHVE